jgi:PAS domain S-box-containing protein
MVISLIAILALMAILLWALESFAAFQATAVSGNSIAHTYQVREVLRNVLSTLTEAETGQRGFLLTGKDNYLVPFNAALLNLGGSLDEIAALTQDNPVQQQALTQVRLLARDKAAELRKTIDLYKQSGSAAALAEVQTGRGKETMDRLRLEVAGMLREEQRLLESRRATERADTRATERIMFFGGAALLILLTGLSILLYRKVLPRPGGAEAAARTQTGGRAWVGYAIALGGTLAAVWSRRELVADVGPDLPVYLTFYPVIVLSALFGGTGAGLLATVLSATLINYFFIPPIGTFWIERPVDMASMAIFVTINLMLSVVSGALRNARHRTQQQASELAQTVDLLDLANVLVRDLDDRIIRWNTGSKRLYGFTSEQAVGKFSHDLLRTHFPEPLERIRDRLLATGRWEGELRHTASDGRELYVASEWMLRRGPAGKPGVIIEVNADITGRRAAEDSLRQSEERFRTLTEAASQIVWLSTPLGDPAADSPSWRQFTGRTIEQWNGWNWLDAIHAEDRPRAAAAWRTALERALPYLDEYRLLHASGVYRHVQARAVPIRNPDATVREWVGTLTDLTSAKRAEAARNAMAAILADSDDAVIAKSLEGRITSWNRGAERLFGYRAEQVLGKSIRLLIPPDRQEEEDRTLAAIRRGEKVEHYESVRLTSEGRLIDVSITSSPIRDSSGQIVGASKIARDITDRKRAEEQLRLQAAALSSTANAVVITDPAGAIRWVNPAFEQLTGYSAAEAVGHNPRLLKSGRHDATFFKSLWDTVLAGQVWRGELINKRKDGREYTEQMTITPVPDAAGKAAHFVAIKQDITEIARAREILNRSKEELEGLVKERTARLQEAMGELEHMSYSMIHDMRAPLRAMQSFAMLLEEECAGCLRTQGLDYFRRIRESANRLDRLITDALNYNEVVRAELPTAPVEVVRLLRGMLETYPDLHPSKADITIEFAELNVLGNESLLTQCLGNLLSNAAKFVAPGVRPQIRVGAQIGNVERQSVEASERGASHPEHAAHTPRSTLPDRRVRIWVEDNGIGIPAEAQDKIFRMFQRMHRESEYPGTGIGLTIVKKAAERMGGRVGLESEPGRGSRFWIDLPNAAEAEETSRVEDAA